MTIERWPIVERIVVLGLVALFVAEAVSSMLLTSLTFDETAHIPAGYVYLTKRSFVLNREHPPLVKEIAALPLLFFHMPAPGKIAGYGDPRGEWEFGYRFLYLSGLNIEKVAFCARLPMALLGVLLGLGIYAWSRALFSSRVNNSLSGQSGGRLGEMGRVAALSALGFWAFSPNILAHSQLVTTDIALCAFALWQQYLLWRFLRERKPQQLILSAVFLGCALGAKHSALLLLPISCAEIFLGELLRGRTDSQEKSSHRSAWLSCAVLVGFAGFILWAIYFFRMRPLPFSDYVEGLKMALRFRHKWAYFFGEAREGNWLLYFPAVFALKTPIPTLLLGCAGLVLFLTRLHGQEDKRALLDCCFVIVVPALFFAFAVATGMNIGYRHVLIVLPYAFLLAGYAVERVWRRGLVWLRAVIAVLLLWYVAGSALIAPHYLTYFNEIAGGPKGGVRYFVDSNIDWGQELIGLRIYLARHGIERVYFSYFGTASPVAYGVPCIALPSREAPLKTEELADPPEPGYYAISVTNLKVPVTGHPAGYYRYFSEREPLARIGNSIYFYKVK